MAQYKDGDSKTIGGVTYIRQGGVWLPGGGGSPAIGPAIGGNPLIPGQLAAQPVQNANTQANTGKTVVDTREVTAKLPYVGPTAAAQAREAEANATIAEHKAQEERIAAAKADLEKFGGQEQVDQLINAVERAKRLVGKTTAGTAGALASHIPGTDAYDLKRIIEQEVRGNVFLQRLQALKDENPSPNGGTGIGRIMQAEIPMITGSSGTLDIGMKPSELLQSLDQIEHGALRMKAKIGGKNPDDPKALLSVLPDATVADEVKRRIQSGEDPAQTINYLNSVGRPPDQATVAAVLANRGNQSPDVRPPNGGGYPSSYLGQGVSGANEGLASVLGAPIDMGDSAANLFDRGVNALAGTDLPTTFGNAPFGAEWWKRRLSDAGSIQAPTSDPSKQFVRRVGQSVGAAAVPGMFGGSLPKFGAGLLSGVGGGVGAATAQQVAPNNPLAEMAGDLIGSGATGFGLLKAAQRVAQRGIESAVPTVEDLKTQARNLYRKAETNGVVASPEQTQQLAAGMHGILRDEGQIGPAGKITDADTNTSKAYNLVQQYAGKEMTPKEMNTVRTVLADSRQSSDPADRRLGSVLLNHFDEWASPLAPEFDQARSVAGRYLQAQDLERARELAGARASQFTGSGFENALRTEYRGLDRANIKGQNYFAPDVTDAIQTVARGTPVSNTLRGLGRLAPTGPVSGMGSVVPAVGVGALTNPVTGGMFGGGLAGMGILGRVGATRMGIRAADQAELIARNGGALDRAPLMPNPLDKYAAWLAAAQQAKYLNGH
jgi:hypothetical protein